MLPVVDTSVHASRVSRAGSLLLEVVLLVAMVPTVVFNVAAPLLGQAGLRLGRGEVFGRPATVAVQLDPGAVAVQTSPQLPSVGGSLVEPGAGLEFTTPLRTQVAVYVPDLRQRLGLAGGPVLGGLVTLAVLVLLLLVVRTLRRGEVFTRANAARLLGIAALVGLGGEASVLLSAWGRWVVVSSPRVAPYVVQDVHVTWVPLVAGLGTAVAAEVFRRGVRMRRDLEGLV